MKSDIKTAIVTYAMSSLTCCAPENKQKSDAQTHETWGINGGSNNSKPNHTFKDSTFCNGAKKLKLNSKVEPLPVQIIYAEAHFSYPKSNINYDQCLSITSKRGVTRSFLVTKDVHQSKENDGYLCWNDHLINQLQVCFSTRDPSFTLRWPDENRNNGELDYEMIHSYVEDFNIYIKKVEISFGDFNSTKGRIFTPSPLIKEPVKCLKCHKIIVNCKSVACDHKNESCDAFKCESIITQTISKGW